MVCVLGTTSGAVAQIPDSSARFPVYLNKKYGYIDEQGQLIIKPRFDWAMSFSEGLAAVVENSQMKYIDVSGKVVITVSSGRVRGFSEGLAAVMFGSSYGYIDRKGNVVIRPQFEAAFDFSEGLARVKFNGEWAFVDKSGRTLFVAPFDYADDFRNGYALVMKRFRNSEKLAAGDLKVSFIGKTGQLTSIGWWNAASPFSDSLAVVSKDPNITAGFARGEPVMDNLDITDPVNAFLKPVSYSFINTNGRTVFAGTFEQVNAFADHRAAVRIQGKWGYVNELGEMIIPPQFDGAETFSEGLAFVKVNDDDAYFIDTSGKIVFRTNASLVTRFTNGLAQLMSCKVSPCRSFYVDKQGKIVWQGVFDNVN
jgi:hypothetical protein